MTGPVTDNGARWSGIEERGSMAPMRAMLAALRWFPRWCLVPVARLVSLYFMLTGREARAASRDYLHRFARAYPDDGIAPGPLASYRHFAAFGDAILDRLAAWSGKLHTSDIDFENQAEYQQLVDSRRGALLLGSHLGNIEMCRALCSLDRIVRVNALAHTRHAGKINRLLDEAGAADFRLWQVSDLDAEMALELRARVERGEWVVVAADRQPLHGGRTVPAQLLGHPAAFPIGPYVLASVLGCPVYLMFCLRVRGRHRFIVEPFAEKVSWQHRDDREVVLAQLAQRYASRVEYHLRMAPLQWFNFYPFWSGPAQAGRASGAGRRPATPRA
ncbi:MAG: hypothetical protein U1F09_12790 [Steroidobacteraceae bacterium]